MSADVRLDIDFQDTDFDDIDLDRDLQFPVLHSSNLTVERSQLVGSLNLWVSFAEYSFFCRALLQKRPIIEDNTDLAVISLLSARFFLIRECRHRHRHRHRYRHRYRRNRYREYIFRQKCTVFRLAQHFSPSRALGSFWYRSADVDMDTDIHMDIDIDMDKDIDMDIDIDMDL